MEGEEGWERERGRQVRCQTAAVTAGQGLQAVTHAETPCRNRTVGEGLPVQEPMGEERCVDGWGSVLHQSDIFCKSKPKQRCNNKNARAVPAGSAAICQILM